MKKRDCYRCGEPATFNVWDEEEVIIGACQTHLRRVIETLMGSPDEVIMVSKTGFPEWSE